MERAQRARIPTAKAADNNNSSNLAKQIDPKNLQIVTPEWKDLPTDPTFFEPANEIPKIEPLPRLSSTSGEKWQMYHLGAHLESKDKFHYTRAKGDPNTGLFHKTEVPPYHGRASDEMHPLCNISEFTMDFLYSKDMLTTLGRGASRTVKANVCAREGTWFFEAKILSCQDEAVTNNNILQHKKNLMLDNPVDKERGDTLSGAPRIGFARREHPQGLVLGASGYSYAVNCYGTKNGNDFVSGGIRKEIPDMPVIKENDVIGMMITLPSLDEHRRILEADLDSTEGSNAASGSSKKSKKSKKKDKTKPDPDAAPESGHVAATSAPGFELPDKPSSIDIIHERYPIRARGGVYFESSEYLQRAELKPMGSHSYLTDPKKIAGNRPVPRQPLKLVDAPAYHDWHSLRGLPGSKIEVWVNGKYIGVVAENLLAFLPPASVVDVQKKSSLPPNMHSGLWDDGTLGYYPAVSHYADSMVEFRFDNFWYGHDDRQGVRPFEKRYNEAIVEDMVSDMIDEIQWEVEHRASQ